MGGIDEDEALARALEESMKHNWIIYWKIPNKIIFNSL